MKINEIARSFFQIKFGGNALKGKARLPVAWKRVVQAS